MPKKLNFLGGQQNYDADNGQYLPDLTNKDGEPIKNFKNFKKAEDKDESFDAINNKRMGKETESFDADAFEDELDEMLKDNYVSYYEDDEIVEELEKKKQQLEINKDKLDEETYNRISQKINDNLEGAKQYIADTKEGEETTNQDNSVGKITKYSPFMRQADGSWKKDDTQQKRIKTLHNGLGIETKAQSKEQFYHDQVGKYRLIDIETGTTVGWAKDFDDAIKKSQDQDFIGAISRAKKVFFEKHPELKESTGKPVDYNAKRLGK